MPQQIYTLSCEDAIAFLCEAAWGFAEVAPDGNFIWVNRAFCDVLNAPADLILGTRYQTWTHAEDLEIDERLAGQVKNGEINNYTLSKRYIQRGSTKEHPRVIWGMLSVQGKYSQTGEFLGYRAQFRPYEQEPKQTLSSVLENTKILAEWTVKNWKIIATIIAVSSTLIFGGSETLIELLLRAKGTADSVDGALQESPSGASSP